MDGVSTEVIFPASDNDDPEVGCPESWQKQFCKFKQDFKFPYVYNKLDVQNDQTPVGKAFRNYMRFVLDYNGVRKGKVPSSHEFPN